MRIFTKAAAATAAAGLLALGAVAGTGEAALAGTGVPVTACTAQEGALAIGLLPNCSAGTSTVNNPTSITITLNTTALGALLAVIPGLGMRATWTLTCNVNGAPVSKPGSYTVTTVLQSASTTIDLQSAVGSPEPNQCTVSGLNVQTTVALTIGALSLSPFAVGVNATANTAVPGAVWQAAGATSGGARAALCADDTGNGNAGSKIQGFECLSDLADYFVMTSAGQLVHNGDCVTAAGGKVTLARCAGGHLAQEWTQSTAGGTVKNKGTGTCLTAPSPKPGVQLTVAACGSAASQKWSVPGISA
jgi:hypothetical protein